MSEREYGYGFSGAPDSMRSVPTEVLAHRLKDLDRLPKAKHTVKKELARRERKEP